MTTMATALIPITREPARIAAQGTFPLPGLGRYTIGRDALAESLPSILQAAASGMLTVDTEGCGLDGRKRYDTKAVIFGTQDEAWVFDPRDPYQFEMIRRILNDTNCRLTFHNSTHDVPILYLNGLLDLESIERAFDTVITARLAEPDEKQRKSLTNSANRYLGLKLSDPLKDILKATGLSLSNWYEFKDLDVPAYRIMAATDAILTARIVRPVQQAAYDRLTTGHPFTQYGLTAAEALAEMEKPQILNRMHLKRSCLGYLIDPEYLDKYRDASAKELRQIEQDLEFYGIRPGNSGDLTSWLEKEGHLPDRYPRTKKTGQPSGAKDNLKRLNHPVARQFIRHKEETHILRDYLDKTLDNADAHGRIHPVTNMLAAATGRMSISGDAAVHQFSAPARGIILADDHEAARRTMKHPALDDDGEPVPCTCHEPRGFTSIDWSQIEPVIVANIAGDVQAVRYYESGNKFYDALVEFGGMQYKAAKTTLLAQLYGEGITKLAEDLGVTIDEAKQIRDMVWKTLPGTNKLAGRGGKLQQIAQQFKLIFTMSGRIVPIPAGWRACWEDHEDAAEISACSRCNDSGLIYNVQVHKGVSYFVQGSAYDLLAEAELAIIKAGLGDAIYFAMHDEHVVDSQAAHDIRRIMETPPERLIQLARRTPVLRTDMAHLGERWAAA